MYNIKLVLAVLISVILFGLTWNKESSNFNEDVSVRVDDLISKMTLEEKVGQMTQVTLQVVSKTQGTVDQKFKIDPDKLKEAIIKYHVGSILNVYDVAHSVDEWHILIKQIQDLAINDTRLGIPIIYGIDAIHGATYTKEATLFPQAINMAATWNKELVKKEGEITSKQVRASGIPWNFYPVMDIGRQPLWSRLWETYGEDVYLASTLGTSYIKGAQGEEFSSPDKVATCLKHYVGYSFPLNGKDRTPAWISERMLREYFLPTFEAGIKAGAPTIMINSSEINGIPVHSDYHLLTEVLRDELNFEGFVVSDWQDIINLHIRDRVAATPEEAVKMAVMAGVDMSMVPYDFSFYDILLRLVKEGEVPVSRIDEAVKRILTVKMRLGLFENPMPIENFEQAFNNSEYDKINFQAAVESIILTKNNDDLLPLSKETKVLITGPTANLLSSMNGGWSYIWQGNEEKLYPEDENTVLEAISKLIGVENVTYVESPDFDKVADIEKIKKAVTLSDVIIVCLGEPAYCETPGNINNLTLDEAQLNLVDELSKTGKPIVIVMLEGRPRIIDRIVQKSDAVLIGFLPGLKGGDAIASIIFGDENPSAKLPVTYPKDPNGLMCYDYKPIEGSDSINYNAQWGFGYGLSYTNFEYSDLSLDKNEIGIDEEITITVNVKNTGSRIGKEVVQLYLCDMFGSVSRPVKQLKGFEKLELKPGEVKQVNFILTPEQLSFIGRDNKRIIEAGDFKVYVDKLEASFKLL
jgi:beta-glucosidase